MQENDLISAAAQLWPPGGNQKDNLRRLAAQYLAKRGNEDPPHSCFLSTLVEKCLRPTMQKEDPPMTGTAVSKVLSLPCFKVEKSKKGHPFICLIPQGLKSAVQTAVAAAQKDSASTKQLHGKSYPKQPTTAQSQGKPSNQAPSDSIPVSPRTLLSSRTIGPLSSPASPEYLAMMDHLNSTWVLAVDCEWSGNQISLIQLAAPVGLSPENCRECIVYLLDMTDLGGSTSSASASQATRMLRPLQAVLEKERVLKVFHDARGVNKASGH